MFLLNCVPVALIHDELIHEVGSIVVRPAVVFLDFDGRAAFHIVSNLPRFTKYLEITFEFRNETDECRVARVF